MASKNIKISELCNKINQSMKNPDFVKSVYEFILKTT